MGVVSSRRRRRRPPKRQIASLQQDGMSKFTVRCSDDVALARTNFSDVNVLNLGAAHTISSAFYRVWHERVCVA